MVTRPGFASFVSASLLLAAGACTGAIAQCVAENARFDVGKVDQSITAHSKLAVDCDFSSPYQAEDCIGRVLPSLLYGASYYLASQATMLVQVTFLDWPDASNHPNTSFGTAFLVDKKKGLYVTARHVLVSDRVWSTALSNHQFQDLESAIENHLQNKTNVLINLSVESAGQASEAQLVALDRQADLALLQIKSLSNLPMQSSPDLLREESFARGFDCGNDSVSAIGYSDVVNPGEFRRSSTTFSPALCDFSVKAYHVGERMYNFSLYSTEAAFRPGYSGGPVFNQRWELVGVVSGATAGNQAKFFVPLSQVQAFLSRFK